MALPAGSVRLLFLRRATLRPPSTCLGALQRASRAQLLVRNFASKPSKLPGNAKRNTPTFPAGAKKPAVAPPKTTEPAYSSLEERLGMAGKPTLLYAKRSTGFLLGCYGICAGSIAWIIYTYTINIANKPPGIPDWVSTASWVGIALMTAVVLVTGFYPTRIIQKIYATPIPPVGYRPASVSIVLHRRAILPLLPNKKIVVNNPKMIILDSPLRSSAADFVVPHGEAVKVGLGRRMMRAASEGPFRLFSVAKSAITTNNFISLGISNGESYMLHKDGWVWEKRGLERLLGLRKY